MSRRSRLVVAISGSSGLIGSALTRAASERRGGEVRRLVRVAPRARRDRSVVGSPTRRDRRQGARRRRRRHQPRRRKSSRSAGRASRCAGFATAACRRRRSSPRRWQRSRRKPTRACQRLGRSATTASAATRCSTRRARVGNDFLASVCKDWEAATAPAPRRRHSRRHQLRTGIVLVPRRRRARQDAHALPPRRGRPAGERPPVDELDRDRRLWSRALALPARARGAAGPVEPRCAQSGGQRRVLAHARVGARIGRRSFRCRARARAARTDEMAEEAVLASQRVAAASTAREAVSTSCCRPAGGARVESCAPRRAAA